MNIGIRFLQNIGAMLDFGENSLQIGPTSIQLLPPKKKPSFASIEEITGDNQHQKVNLTKGAIRVYNKSTTIIPPHSVSIIHLKLHSKEYQLTRHSKDGHPPTLEVETDGKFAQSMNIASPLNAVTSSERLLLPIANETDVEIIVKKNKRVGKINVLQTESKEFPTSSKEASTSPSSP